ncbi:MAG: LexA family transcriptional regulator [Sulfurospirillaceae bacterium]|nr:LexA family transcriptional regulator [Sulfurospirillaceae bacterium]
MPNIFDILGKIKDILSQEVGERKVFDKDVAEALSINQISLATMKTRNKIPYKEVLEFCAKRKISINWLLFDQFAESVLSETEKYSKIHYFKDIYASAGGGGLSEDEGFESILLDEKIIQKIGGNTQVKHIQAINVMGDSMEPTLNSGDVVFINRELTNPSKGGIYVVSTPAGLFIKRLQLRSDGTVALVSDNESYSDEIVLASNVDVLGKVVGKLSSSI